MEAHDRELIDVALAAARQAAELQRSSAGLLDPALWGEKGASDFVTEVDRESERVIVETLQEHFSTHAVLAEEGTIIELGAGETGGEGDGGEVGGEQEIRWIIDPLDGTTNWLHGYPEYAVSIAALDADGLRVGVVVNSASGEEYVAARGAGSQRNGEPIHTSDLAELRLALLGTGFPFKKLELLPDYLVLLDRALRATSGVRRAGAAALDLCALACGRLDAFWETWLMPWDVAAGALIVREAGGSFVPLELDEDRDDAAGSEGGDALRAAAEGGREFVAVCDGHTEWRRPSGGAYMAANAHLLGELRRTLSGA